MIVFLAEAQLGNFDAGRKLEVGHVHDVAEVDLDEIDFDELRQILRQARNLVEEGRRGRQPGAGLGLDRRLLERGGHLFVRPGGRSRQVPYPTIRIDSGIGHLGERQVGGAAILGGSGGVDRRPY